MNRPMTNRRQAVQGFARTSVVSLAVLVATTLAPNYTASAVGKQSNVVAPTTVAPSATTATLTATPIKVAAITIVASAKVATTPVYETASATKPFVTFNNKTNFSGRHVFVVLAQQGDSFKVLLPMRPNGRTGFVKAKDVNLYQHDYATVISLSAKTLILYQGGKEVLKDTVAIGSAKYPTPLGSFFMRELARPRNPKGAYGPWAFGLSAYSNVLQKFGRGDGQIGIHGTNQPALLGQNVSHGCIRMRNATITKLAQMLPQGVPVEIIA